MEILFFIEMNFVHYNEYFIDESYRIRIEKVIFLDTVAILFRDGR